MATNGSSLSAAKRTVAAYMAMVIISPCAKLTTRTTPKITDRPSAISPQTRPVRTPETTTLATRSAAGLSSGFLVVRRRVDRLRGGGLFRQHDGRREIHVMHARRADAFDL